jgi:hypothetical protein
MSVNSVSGNAQAMSRPQAAGEPPISGRNPDLPESGRIGLRTKVRVAGWFVMSLLLLITALAVVINRFDIAFDGAPASEVQREVAQ